MVVLKTADQGLSIYDLIILLMFSWVEFQLKLLIFGVVVTFNWMEFNSESAVPCAQRQCAQSFLIGMVLIHWKRLLTNTFDEL